MHVCDAIAAVDATDDAAAAAAAAAAATAAAAAIAAVDVVCVVDVADNSVNDSVLPSTVGDARRPLKCSVLPLLVGAMSECERTRILFSPYNGVMPCAAAVLLVL